MSEALAALARAPMGKARPNAAETPSIQPGPQDELRRPPPGGGEAKRPETDRGQLA